MTPSWSQSIIFRPIWSWGRCWWLGGINPRFLAFRILKIDPLFIACHNPMQERLSFLSGKQNLACILASLHLRRLSFNSCGTHFPIFWTFPMACSRMEMAAWDTQLLGKHFLRLGIVLVQKSLQLTILNLPGPIFTLLVTQVKIGVIEPVKPISVRCFR